MDASYVDLADARHLEFDYLRWARLVLRTCGARQVLHLGGAACTLARALLAEDGESRHDVVEIDPQVLEMARAHLGLVKRPGLRIRVGDGRAAVTARPDDSADAVVIDAFLGARIPRHLVTAEALGHCARVAPLTIVNVVDAAGWPDSRAIIAGLREFYGYAAALGGGSRRGGNVIVFGARARPRLHRLESAAAADAAPARLYPADALSGAAAWRDEV